MAALPKLRPGLDPNHISKVAYTIEVPTSAEPGCVSGLVAGKCGLMAVLEENDRKLFIYNHERSDVLEFPLDCPKFSYANQMAFDKHNNIIIAQGDLNNLLRFNMNGKALPPLDAPVNGSTGVACSPEGDIFVSSHNPCTIVKQAVGKSEWVTLYRSRKADYDADEDEYADPDFEFEFDPTCYSPGQISYGSNGELFVGTDTCINVLNTSDGKLKRQIGCGKYREGKMSKVEGIFATGDGYLFVCDQSYYVHTFTTDGEFLSSFGGDGDEPGMFQQAWGITVDWSGYVLVSDVGSSNIHVY